MISKVRNIFMAPPFYSSVSFLVGNESDGFHPKNKLSSNTVKKAGIYYPFNTPIDCPI